MDTAAARLPAKPASRPFYGWVVVAGTFIVLFIGFGTAYSFAAFFHSLRDEFNATRGDVSLVFAITGFLYFSLGAVSGPLADRFGPRRVVAFGTVLIAAGLLLASRAQTLWQVYLTYSIGVGLGVGFAYVPAIGAVQRWFVRRRGFASGMAVAGIGVGNLAFPPLAAALIDLTDWRTAYVVLAVLALVTGTGAALLLEHSPQRRGLLPDGAAAGSRQSAAGAAAAPFPPGSPGRHGSTMGTGATEFPGSVPDSRLPTADSLSGRAAVRSRPFWLLYGATVATSLGLFIPFAHLAPYARDHGHSDVTGAVLVGLIGAGSAAGRLVLGGTADRVGRRRSLGAAFAGMALMLVWWLGATSVWALAAFAVLFGACYGGFVALLPALTSDYFGGRNAGAILGVLYTAAGIGALAGPYLAGRFYDLNHSYELPIAFSAAANLGAVACMVLLADPARWRQAYGT